MKAEDTILNEDLTKKVGNEETVISQNNDQTVPLKGKKKIRLNKMAAFAAGIGAAGSAVAASIIGDDDEVVPDDNEDNSAEDESEIVEPVQDEPVVNDEMSFGEAFAAARAAYGPGAMFEWRGNVYNTYYKEELEHAGEDNDPVVADSSDDVVNAEPGEDDEVQVVGAEDYEEAIIIDDSETAYVADVDEVYVGEFDDPGLDEGYMPDDPMF